MKIQKKKIFFLGGGGGGLSVNVKGELKFLGKFTQKNREGGGRGGGGGLVGGGVKVDVNAMLGSGWM